MSNRNLPVRRTVRLAGYNYAAAGGYFITLVTHERQCLFGEIVDAEVRLNELGEIVQEEWLRSADIRPGILLEAFVVMPNHVHGVVIFSRDDSANDGNSRGKRQFRRDPRSVSSLVAGFKAATTTRINMLRQTPGQLVWQRNFYEHVIRNDADLERIREYIAGNPAKWQEDSENPQVWAVQRRRA
jgi:putative transposase